MVIWLLTHSWRSHSQPICRLGSPCSSNVCCFPLVLIHQLKLIFHERLLHDLGWDKRKDSPFITQEPRFEVDGAIAAREFVRGHPDGKKWDERKVQLMWDTIAIHTEAAFWQYTELEVSSTALGMGQDFRPPAGVITQQQYDDVWVAYPGPKWSELATDKMVWLCKTKPNSTYCKQSSFHFHTILTGYKRGCNLRGAIGSCYSAKGHHRIDQFQP